jgi:hypothetical protein
MNIRVVLMKAVIATKTQRYIWMRLDFGFKYNEPKSATPALKITVCLFSGGLARPTLAGVLFVSRMLEMNV